MIDEKHFRNYLYTQFLFFTNWVLLLIVFYYWTQKWFNLYLLSLIVYIGGSFFFYVDPGYIHLNYRNELLVLGERKKDITHILFHLLPFVFIIWKALPTKFKDYYDDRTLNSILLLFLYLLVINVNYLYSIRWKEIKIVSIWIIVIYVATSFLFFFSH